MKKKKMEKTQEKENSARKKKVEQNRPYRATGKDSKGTTSYKGQSTAKSKKRAEVH